MFRLSPYRLQYGREHPLVTAQTLRMIEQIKNQQGSALETSTATLPKFIYQIEHVVLF